MKTEVRLYKVQYENAQSQLMGANEMIREGGCTIAVDFRAIRQGRDLRRTIDIDIWYREVTTMSRVRMRREIWKVVHCRIARGWSVGRWDRKSSRRADNAAIGHGPSQSWLH